MVSEKEFGDLLDRLYGAGTRAEGFEPFLLDLKGAFNSHLTALHFHDLEHQLHDFHLAVGITEEEVAANAARVKNQHLWFERGQTRLLEDGIVDDRNLVPKKELLQSTFYREFLSRMDIRHGLAIRLSGSQGGQLAAITINRDTKRGYFSDEDQALAKRIIPHARNIFELQKKLSWAESMAGGFRAALDRLPFGVFLLSRHARATFSNRGAQRLLQNRCGVEASKGCLRPVYPYDRLNFTQMLAKACVGIVELEYRTMTLHDIGGLPIATASASTVPPPISTSWSESAAAAILFVQPWSARIGRSADALKHAFAFTEAEAELAMLLGAGLTTAAAAARLGKSISTVRTQLRAVFAKTGTHRQAELIQLLTALLASGLGN